MIFCVEDDSNIRELVVYTLNATGMSARGFGDGKSFMEAVAKETPELVLLDIMLPGEDGLHILKKLKSSSKTKHIPVIMVTAKGNEYDKVIGLDAGADDYVSKPYEPMILVEKLRAMIRRTEYSNKSHGAEGNRHEYCGGELIIDGDVMQAFKHEESCDLTNREFQLLQYLEQNMGRVCSRSELLKQVWKFDFLGDERTVDVTIKRTRQKIEPDQKNFKYILTRRGFGYFFPNDLD